jgi:hypothetical protein
MIDRRRRRLRCAVDCISLTQLSLPTLSILRSAARSSSPRVVWPTYTVSHLYIICMSFVYHLYVICMLFVYHSYGMVCMARYGTAETLGVIRVDHLVRVHSSRQPMSRQAALSKCVRERESVCVCVYTQVGGGGQRDRSLGTVIIITTSRI